jgi:hypothetical protein
MWASWLAATVLIVGSAGCSSRGLGVRADAGEHADLGAVADGVVRDLAAQADAATAVLDQRAEAGADDGADAAVGNVDAGSSAAACWGNEHDQLPGCAQIDACVPTRLDGECTQTGECEFAFPERLSIAIIVFVNCLEVPEANPATGNDGWVLSDDQHRLLLVGAACESAKVSPPPRILVEAIHSCIP